jgi:adenine/guanine phosphoribosyltransferase-like PRPP-binding protein
LGAHIVGMAFLIELDALKGRDALKGIDVETFITY